MKYSFSTRMLTCFYHSAVKSELKKRFKGT